MKRSAAQYHPSFLRPHGFGSFAIVRLVMLLAVFMVVQNGGRIVMANGIIICSTGFATATAAGCGAGINSPGANNLTADGNWYLASNSSGTFQSQAFVTINNSFPVQNAGPWLANNANDTNGIGAGSVWIVPSNNQPLTYINSTYYFSTQFALTAAQAASASISGYWLADDYGGGIFLNGVSVAQAGFPVFGSNGGPMIHFTITNGNPQLGQAVFVAGTNNLTFGVVNDSTNHGTITGGNKSTGVRVLITSGVTAANVSVSGRVLTPAGRGLRNASVSITDPSGVKRTVTTSSFGFYTFDNVATGESYVIGVASKLYRFSPRLVQVNDTLTEEDFVGQE